MLFGSKTNYTVVGVVLIWQELPATALGCLLALIKKYRFYAVYIHEAVSGLSEQSPVKFNGVKVGFVSQISLNRQDPQQVRLLLSIEDGIPITTSTTATLISQGITGTTYVGLSASSPNLTPLVKAPNQPYPVIPASPSLFNQLDKVLKEVSENVGKVSKKVGEIFDAENAAYIKKSLANIKTFTDIIAQEGPQIRRSLKSADVLLKNMSTVSNQLPELVTELRIGLTKFKNMASAMTAAGKSVSSTMKTGKTAIDKISQQTVPSADTLLRRLDVIAANLEKVSTQMRQNPSVIIRGTTPPPPGPGE